MSSRCRDIGWRGFFAAALATLVVSTATARELRVCADPDNLPYSNSAEQGFENRIAKLVARDLDARLTYYWLPQWRGFTRKTLLEGHCDVIPGVPTEQTNVRVTTPYYHGVFSLVYRADRVSALAGLDDPRLRTLRLALPLVGIDAAPTPTGRALARRGIYDNIVGFPVIGDKPAAERMFAALDAGDVDVAAVWSPQAGYYMRRAHVPLSIVLLQPQDGDPPFEFAIAMAVRPDDAMLQRELNASLARMQPEIQAILRQFGVVTDDDDTMLGHFR